MPVNDEGAPAVDFLAPGTPVDLDTCDREPIHLPGSILPHGTVVVARERDGVIVQTAANAAGLLGAEPATLLGATLAATFGEDAAAAFTAAPAAGEGPSIHPARVTLPGSGTAVDTHVFRPASGLLGIELEPASPAAGDELGTIGRVTRWSTALRSAGSIEALVGAAAEALRELTGFDRVWAYRFEPDGHGIVVAEHKTDALETFLGLHFPESDIPPQARALYLRNPVRVIPDVAAQVAPLVPLENPESGGWLDLSGSSLRSVSPMHLRYLRNMGVHASMSVSLIVDGRLWGLLSAHHYAGPRLVPMRVRGECELLGTMTSAQLATAAELERTQHDLELQQSTARVLDALGEAGDIADGLASDPEALLGVCRAAGAIVRIGERRHLVGATPGEEGVDRILAALAATEDTGLVVTDSLAGRDPALEDLAALASGAIAVPLSRRQGNWLVWLRPESVQEVTWGNRDKALVRRDPSGVLELGERESYERWAETVHLRSRPWHPAEVDAVAGLRSAIGALLIARADELARLNDELARSNAELDSFAYAAAHDLREPVRGIEQFADFFLEDHEALLQDEGRSHIDTIKRLAGRMDDLLAALLDYAQLGRLPAQLAPIHLPTMVAEVRELLAARIGDTRIEVADATVTGDPEGVRQLLLNLVWNALKYAPPGSPIELGVATLTDAEAGTPRVRRSLYGDAEPVAVFVRDHGIGIHPDHHDVIFELFRRLHGREEYGGGSGAGLTLSRRIVDRHGGVIWVESTLGDGATFWFTLEPA